MKQILATILFLLFFLPGNSQSMDPNKAIIDYQFKKHFQFLIDGDTGNFANGFSRQFTKSGPERRESGKEPGDGNVKKFEDFFLPKAKEILSYHEYMAIYGKASIPGITLKEGDYYFYYEPSGGQFSYQKGYKGFYRKENKEWKIIGNIIQ